jgi:hypothetical protein
MDNRIENSPSRQNLKKTRGVTRMRELAAEAEAARQAGIADLTEAVWKARGREPTATERRLIASAVSAEVEAAKLRRKGRSSLAQDRLVVRCVRSLGLEPPDTVRMPRPKPKSTRVPAEDFSGYIDAVAEGED